MRQSPAGHGPVPAWITFVSPLAVFLLLGALEPPPEGVRWARVSLAYESYPWVYLAKVVLTTITLAWAARAYRAFPWRLSRLWLPVGVVGGLLWIGICRLQWEARLLAPLGLSEWASSTRSAYDPFAHLNPPEAWAFLGLRFFGLVLLVPMIEELFLRGFVMRFITAPDWWKVDLGQVSRGAIVAGTVVPMLMHPGELLAAAAWFSLITWLMLRTKGFWDCVAAHATTNLVLGIYVVSTGHWQLL